MLSPISASAIESIESKGWPSVTLFSGRQSKSKIELVVDTITKELYQSRLKEESSLESIRQMARSGEHPDFYRFGPRKIKIGEAGGKEPGSIRHLTEKVLTYSPKYAKKRFVLFEDASLIQNEAESALLKSLEESASHTHFVLCAEELGMLKETIISRSIHVPLEFQIDPERVSPDPWERFWYLSQWDDTSEYDKLKELGWLDIIKEGYDTLRYDSADYAVFEDLGWVKLKEVFKKENNDTQIKALYLTWLPLYFSLRDALTGGALPQVGPVAVPFTDRKQLLYLARMIERLFQRLKMRYFGTIPPALNMTFFAFLPYFMRHWKR